MRMARGRQEEGLRGLKKEKKEEQEEENRKIQCTSEEKGKTGGRHYEDSRKTMKMQ